MTVDTNIAAGSIVTSSYDGTPKHYEVLENDGTHFTAEGAIPVRDIEDDLPLYLFANEIDSINATPDQSVSERFGELLKAIFPTAIFDESAAPEGILTRNTDALVDAAKLYADSITEPNVRLEFSDTPGVDSDNDRRMFNDSLLWLAARYNVTVEFDYLKPSGGVAEAHSLVPASIEPGLDGSYFLFGGEDQYRRDAYRKFRTDRVEGYVYVDD